MVSIDRFAGCTALLLAVCTAVLVTALPAAAAVRPPPAHGALDYQLGGAYPPPAGTQIVVRDRTASPAPGTYGICYINAFQSQPQEERYWLRRHPTLLLKRRGKLVEDPGWPGEYVFDTSTSRRRHALARVVGHWIDGCAAKGFDAVEPDNLDSYTRRGAHRLSASSNLAYAKLLIARAHQRGLAIAQKNASELSGRGKALGFDFAVAESCQVYRECVSYTGAYGSEVLEVEYASEGGVTNFHAACADHGDQISIVYRDVDLLTPGHEGYAFARC